MIYLVVLNSNLGNVVLCKCASMKRQNKEVLKFEPLNDISGAVHGAEYKYHVSAHTRSDRLNSGIVNRTRVGYSLCRFTQGIH